MRRLLRAGALLLAAGASLATSPPRSVRNYPAWVITSGAEMSVGCGDARAWVSKSGKEGMGVTVRLVSSDGGRCGITIEEARLDVVGLASVVGEPPRELTASGKEPAFAYVPFVFDDESAWNAGQRTGAVVMRLGGGITWTMPAEHRLDGFHIDAQRGAPP